MIISLADAKAHLNILDDTDDALITSKIKVAQAYLEAFVDVDVSTCNAPAPLKEAARQIVATLYENRESAIVGANLAVLPMPVGVADLISPYRRWVF